MKPFDSGYMALGVVVGGMLALSIFLWLEWFGFSFSMMGNVFPTILGAVIGGGIAIIGQLVTIQHAIREREIAMKSEQKVIAFSLFIKLQGIVNGYLILANHLQKEISKFDPDKYLHLCMAVRSFSSPAPKIEIDPAEKALALEWKEIELFNSIASLDNMYNGINDSFDVYRIKRFETFSGLPATMDGIIGANEIPPERYRELAPNLALLDDLIKQVSDSAERDYKFAREALNELLRSIKENTSSSIKMIFPELD